MQTGTVALQPVASMDIPITQSTKIITPLEETVQILLPSACMKVVN